MSKIRLVLAVTLLSLVWVCAKPGVAWPFSFGAEPYQVWSWTPGDQSSPVVESANGPLREKLPLAPMAAPGAESRPRAAILDIGTDPEPSFTIGLLIITAGLSLGARIRSREKR